MSPKKGEAMGPKSNDAIGGEDGWTMDQTKELLSKMKQAIPQPDMSKYKTHLEKFSWDKVKMDKHSADDCKKQWDRIYKKLRKYKTLSDLISDSLEYLENPYKGCVKKHPDHPKRPLTPYFRFFLSEREKYAATHKDLSNLEITSILSKKYRQITDREKEKYMEEWRAEMVEYRSKMERFKNEHPEYYDKSPPRPSRTPLQIFNSENMESMSERYKKKNKKQLAETLKNKYHALDDDQKLPYIMKAIEEWEKYKEELEMYKKSHPSFVPGPAHKKSVLTINDWKIHDKSLGRPNRPPANGYNLFCTRMMVSDSMKHLTSRERIMECGQRWKLLTEAEKQAYQKEFLVMRENYKSATKNFLKGLTPRQREEYLERKKESENKKNQKRKVPVKVKEEQVTDGSSSTDDDDDENEEMEQDDTTSDESSSSSSEEEEEEAEEEVEKTNSKATGKVTSPVPARPTTPISALFLYQKAHREKLAAKHPSVSKSDITIMLARRYNNLPAAKKAKYIQKEKEQMALYKEQMRKHMMGENDKASTEQPPELKPVTGEQVYQDQNRANFMKKSKGSVEKAEKAMRRSWTQMNKERRKEFIEIAHKQNAKNIEEHNAALAAAKEKVTKKSRSSASERGLSQKEIKAYLALQPKKVPKDGFIFFKREHRPKVNHFLPSARTQELNRIWSELPTSAKNQYKQKAKAGLAEYKKRMQRWLKSLPPQVMEVYNVSLAKKSKTEPEPSKKKAVITGKKRKADAKAGNAKKKAKVAEPEEDSDDSSEEDSSGDDNDSSSSSDDDSDSDSSDSSSDSDSSGSEADKAGAAAEAENSSDDSSSSSSSSDDDDDSDSD